MVTQKSEQGDSFSAIADPTRRGILDLLRGGEMRAGDIAARFPVSRPAIARHVRVLREAGLVRERRESRARLYSLDPAGLKQVDRWLQPYRLYWAARLTDLRRVAEAEYQASKTSGEGDVP